jgi:peroxiredoxin
VPKLNELHEKFKDKGLVIIGVHSDPDTAKGTAAVSETKMAYPVSFDPKGQLMKTLNCDSFPDYVLIDRKGIIRVVDLANGDVPRAVELLINEK